MRALVAVIYRPRPRGRHRATSPRDWPVGWALPVDPWAGVPLFDPALERQRVAAARVTCGRSLKIGVSK